MKRFNVTGLCVPEEDYMVDISGKVAKIKELVDNRCYFTINQARQYGKTTILAALERKLRDEYLVASISFEGLGDDSFKSEETFCFTFMEIVQQSLQFTSTDSEYTEQWVDYSVKTFILLSRHITKMCRDKKLVLMIDEVDKTSNNRVFLHFLSTLREKFLSRKNGKDYTFHSIILAGVYDIKNIKLKMVSEGSYTPSATEDKIYNSPWNIAVNFTVDMSFNSTEIASMLAEYENDHDTGMDIMAIAEEIHNYTSGYPFLVSRICQCVDEELHTNGVRDKDWTLTGVQRAVKILLNEKNTLFDDLFKNLENNKALYDYVYDLLILGEFKPYMIYDPIVDMGIRYCFFKKQRNGSDRVAVSNKIFELLMTDYYIAKDLHDKKKITGVFYNDIIKANKFDMELCLRKFAEHYSEIFTENDTKFLEKHGRLLFLSYLKPLINGQGFYHIESQFTDLRRMDIVVDYGREQFIIELKLWHGEKYKEEAYSQLCGYLDSKGANTGYLLTFDFRKKAKKDRVCEWIEAEGKRIFDVVV